MQNTNGDKDTLARQCILFLVAASVFLLPGFTPGIQAAQHLTITQPGGMPGAPVITGVWPGSNTVTVTWDGPAGYYQLYRKPQSATNWQPVGGLSLARRATMSASYSNASFYVSGPSPRYAGSQACSECHGNIYLAAGQTPHATAFSSRSFAQYGQTNSSCLPCHTVGFGLSTGYNLKSKPQYLTGVQCENCHGPAANHAANENNRVFKPRVEQASQVCGGCHNTTFSPTFDDWASSGHSQVTQDMNQIDRLNQCGHCHSGSVRLALLKGRDPGITVSNDANVPIVCVTCHTPHTKKVWTNVLSGVVYTNQLRNPLSSVKDYYIATTNVFANKYNPNINLCAQCHNHRGASWKDSNRPPHRSPQYNMLLGTVGEQASGVPLRNPASHALMIENQCVGCHMQTAQGSDEHMGVSGHKFKVELFESCARCHPEPELLVSFTTDAIANQIQEVKAALDLWASTRAPEPLRTKYGARAWEYTVPGELSNPAGVTNPGPTPTEQKLLPVNIRKARFNLYLVLQDGSFGVHNARHSVSLLETAQTWVEQALDNN